MRKLPPMTKRQKIRFGTIGYGLDLPRLTWTSETQVFSCQDKDMRKALSHRPKVKETRPLEQLPRTFLKKNPVEALLVDEGERGQGRSSILTWLQEQTHDERPKVVTISGSAQRLCSVKAQGLRKSRRKAFERLGYQSLEWHLASRSQGAALDQERLVEVYYQGHLDQAPPNTPEEQPLPPRNMSNLLRSFEVPRRDYAPPQSIRLDTPRLRGPCMEIGTVGGGNIFDPSGCMPDDLGAWVQDDKRVRRLQSKELAKAKGVPGEWMDSSERLDSRAVGESTSLNIWTAVCDSIAAWLRPSQGKKSEVSSCSTSDGYVTDATEGETDGELEEPLSCEPLTEARIDQLQQEHWGIDRQRDRKLIWDYQLPDLKQGGKWYQARVASLKKAIQGRPDADQLLAEGLEALEVHRRNYTEEGPKYLQVLWWEFPKAHQDAVRLGSTLRFLVDPGEEIVPNPPLTEEQEDVVAEFLDELKALGVLRPSQGKLRRVCPVFVVPKPGQPGQWRCIADMRRGGQNDCCSLDPIILPSSRDILPHLYSGGWSSVADASKYFHNYYTLPEERDLIGMIHPRTGEELVYVGLPMGSVNSPSIACRIGEGILDMLRAECSVF